MSSGCVLVTARCPDPKLAKAALAPFHTSRDGITTVSTSGFVLQLPGLPVVVVTSAAAVFPLLWQQRRQQPLAGATHAELVPGCQLHALEELAPSSSSSSNSAGIDSSSRKDTGSSSNSRKGTAGSSQGPIELRLVGVSELPGVRQALARLLAAPSIAGPGGWQLGWLLHRPQKAQPLPKQLEVAPWSAGSGGSGGTGGSTTGAPLLNAAAAAAVDMLGVASHVAVLLPVDAEGAADLSCLALPWPGAFNSHARGTCSRAALRQGQQVAAVGAPFGALSPQHFSGFVSCGVVSSAIYPLGDGQQSSQPSSGSVIGSCSSTAGHPTLLLSDLRCAPGMEGAPVFAAPQKEASIVGQAAAVGEEGPPLGALAGMMLPPLKSPAAQVELALVAPAHVVALAVAAALQLAGRPCLPPVTPVAVAVTAVAAGSFAAAEGSAAGAAAAAGSANTVAGSSAAPAVAAAAAAAAAPGPLAGALCSVVAVSNGGAWATGVVVSSGGHILTNAHLLETPQLPGLHACSSKSSRGRPGGNSSTSSQRSQAGGQQAAATLAAPAAIPVVLPHPPVRVLLPAIGSSGGSTSGGTWLTADVLYVFRGPLDLAVLQLRRQPGERQLPAWRAANSSTIKQLPAWHQADHSTQQLPAWRAAELDSQILQAGQRVCVAGFPAFNPRGGVLGAVVTAGNLAKVVHLPAGGPPAMLLTTAAVHSGASGGAVLDAATGQLCGLVTSNAKHSSRSNARGTGGGRPAASVQTVLPHVNFSIPAAQLHPVVAAAQAAADAAAEAHSSGSSGSSAAAAAAAANALAAWQAVDAAGAASEELQQVWQLDRQRQRPGQLQPDEAQQGTGGMFGGAAPPAKLQQLLRTLQQKPEQQQVEGQRVQQRAAQQSRQMRQQRAKL